MFYALLLQANGYPLPQLVYWVCRKDVLCPAVAGRRLSYALICIFGVQKGYHFITNSISQMRGFLAFFKEKVAFFKVFFRHLYAT
jgi:hypothetical protein